MTATPSPPLRRARVATGLLFLTNGALFANLIPRYPEIKNQLGMSDALFGLAVAAFPLGAIMFGLFAAKLIRRFGSGLVATVSTLTLGTSLAAATFMPEAIFFALALLAAGAADAIADVSQNAHGLRVQGSYGRSVLNSFHALWSLGAVSGGMMAAGALQIGMNLQVHLVGSAVLFSVIALVAWSMCLPAETSEELARREAEMQPDGAEPVGHGRIQRIALKRPQTLAILGALVLMAMTGAVIEDAGNSWSALYLSEHLGATSAVAAFGFTTLVAGQLLGRSIADRFIDRYGQRSVIRVGGMIIAVGMGMAIAFPTVIGTIFGFGAAGLGSAPILPAAYNRADDIRGLRPGVGLTVVSWLMRLGFLTTPPLVGALSEMLSLRWALLVVPVAGAVTVLLARVLPGRSDPKGREQLDTGKTTGPGEIP